MMDAERAEFVKAVFVLPVVTKMPTVRCFPTAFPTTANTEAVRATVSVSCSQAAAQPFVSMTNVWSPVKQIASADRFKPACWPDAHS